MNAAPKVENRNRAVIVAALATGLALLGDSMLYIALPVYWREVGLDSLWQVGALLAVNRFVRLPINPLIGRLYHRITLRTGLLIAVVLGAISTLGYGFAQGFIAWLILRCLWGVAWSLFRIGGLAAVVRCASEGERGRVMGLYNGLYRLGSLVGMLVGGILVVVSGLPALAWAFGILTLLGIPLLLLGFSLPATTDAPAPTSLRPPTPGKAMSQWPILLTGVGISLLIPGVFTSTFSALIAHHYGTTLNLVGFVIGATALSGMLQAIRWLWEPWLGTLFGHWSDGPRGRRPYLIVALLVGAASFAPMAVSMPLGLWLVCTLTLLMASTALTTLADAAAADTARQVGAIGFMTRYSIGQDLGAAAGPILAYFLLNLTDGFGLLYGGSSLLLLGLGSYWLTRPGTPR